MESRGCNKDLHPDLTNDAKRSAWIEEQKASNPEYETIAREAESARNNADMARLSLNMLRDEFRVARILALARIPDEMADLM